MFFRRLLTFAREPRQWFLTVSPFINVMTFFLILYALFQMSANSEFE